MSTENEATARAGVHHILAVVHAEWNARTRPTADEAEDGADEPGECSGFVADIGDDLTLTVGARGRYRYLADGYSKCWRHHHNGALLTLLSANRWLGCNRLRRIRLLRIRWLCWVRSLRVLAWVITSGIRVWRRR